LIKSFKAHNYPSLPQSFEILDNDSGALENIWTQAP
jgi:hypothetical protein